MKKILIVIGILIAGKYAYDIYTNYQRFHPSTYDYNIAEGIDLNYHDQEMVYAYYEAVSALNGFVGSQWSLHKIDVRAPEDDNIETQAMVAQYGKLKARVAFFEDRLKAAATLKEQGLTNSEIKFLEKEGIGLEVWKEQQEIERQRFLLESAINAEDVRPGGKSPVIFEIQKILVAKGFDIPVDGVFAQITIDAVKEFEQQQNLYPDGRLDPLTIAQLLK